MFALETKLSNGGPIFVTVPNKRSLWERVFRWYYESKQKRKLPLDTSGTSRVKFKNPEER